MDKMKQIRNIAISEVDTIDKYNTVCSIVNHKRYGQEWLIGEEGNKKIGYLSDNGIEDGLWLDYWNENIDNFKNCTKYAYSDFVKKFKDKR